VTDPAAEGARAAARRLGLVAEVEATLHAQDDGVGGELEQYFDPVALASLIVSAAALAWTVYTDLKKKAGKPPPDVVTRTVSTQLRRSQTLTGEQEETVTITVQETIRAIDG
jgi:hypothetical protein